MKIMCIDKEQITKRPHYKLTYGEIYDGRKAGRHLYYIPSINRHFPIAWFVILSEFRENRINSILS
jgi:hypothetical protein